VVYMNKGNYDQAIADYTKAISLDPNSKDAYNNRGNLWATKGLCRRCGGSLGGIFTKKCKSCGLEN
jgi:tetratricopeptide (TPR) repeat protein